MNWRFVCIDSKTGLAIWYNEDTKQYVDCSVGKGPENKLVEDMSASRWEPRK